MSFSADHIGTQLAILTGPVPDLSAAAEFLRGEPVDGSNGLSGDCGFDACIGTVGDSV